MTRFTQIGRYAIEAELGHGAMGSVYRAKDPMMDRVVAIKTILSTALTGPLAEEYRERFLREARAAGRLSHPGIVTVFDVGEHEGTPFLVMEYIAGRTLASALDGGERFSFERVYEIGQQLAEALAFAHASGVIHRDIKPANILLTKAPGQTAERAKIADFGVAKLSATQMTATGQLLGTPSFMPPEQFTGAPVDGRSDIFSLGVILYSLATGDKPFPGDTLTAVSYKVVHTSPLPPRVINPAVPEDLERVILKCLEKDPSRRYATGDELARDLSNLRAGLAPVHAVATAAARNADPDATMDLHIPPEVRAQMLKRAPTVVVPAPVAPAPVQQGTTVAVPPAAPHGTPFSHKFLYVVAGLIALVIIMNGVVRTGKRDGERAAPPVSSEAPAAPAAKKPEPPKKSPASETKSTETKPSTKAGEEKASPAPVTPEIAKHLVNLEPQILKQIEDAKKLAEAAGRAGNLATPQQRQMFLERMGDTMPRPVPAGSARLRVDATQIPMNISFVVFADGKRLFRARGGQGLMHPVYENVFLAAGEHQLHIAFYAGSAMFAESGKMPGSFEPDRNYTLTLALKGRSLEAQLTSGGESQLKTWTVPPAPGAANPAAQMPAQAAPTGQAQGGRDFLPLQFDASEIPAEAAFTLMMDGAPIYYREPHSPLPAQISVPLGHRMFTAHFGLPARPTRSSKPLAVEIKAGENRKLKIGFEGQTIQMGPTGQSRRIHTGRLRVYLE